MVILFVNGACVDPALYGDEDNNSDNEIDDNNTFLKASTRPCLSLMLEPSVW